MSDIIIRHADIVATVKDKLLADPQSREDWLETEPAVTKEEFVEAVCRWLAERVRTLLSNLDSEIVERGIDREIRAVVRERGASK